MAYLIQEINNPIKALGPVPAPMAKRVGRYRYQLQLQSNKRQDLHDLLDLLMPKIEKIKLVKKFAGHWMLILWICFDAIESPKKLTLLLNHTRVRKF